MKKWIIGLLFLASATWAVTTQPQSLGVVTAIIESKTLAQINSFTPKAAGQLVYCSNCTRSGICVSSGTAAGAWVVPTSTATVPAYTSIHCQ